MNTKHSGLRLVNMWREEFRGYNGRTFQKDLLAGITVAAVALPLALAFGVASGATAAAGLITAVVAGIVIGVLGGAPYQVSGPTGTMSAILIVLAARHGLEGVWMVSLLAGILILLMGIFNLGQIINFIPSAVITGFTSGIAVIIFVGQIDNLLGIDTGVAENALLQLIEYTRFNYTPNIIALAISLLVIVIMAIWPPKWNARFPSSLLSLIVATLVAVVLKLDVPVIGFIPQTLWLDDRLSFGNIPWHNISTFIGPAIAIAALGSIESLLTGIVAGRQTGIRMDSSLMLIAQGIGNLIMPFFGGVPATAALARSSVAIRSGGVTRLTSILHGVILLLAALTLAPIISQIPLAALGGVLAVTAWRMNDWKEIRNIFQRRFKSAILIFLTTLVATVALDLTQAILLGLGLSALIFVFQSSKTEVTFAPVSVKKMREAGYELKYDHDRILVVYIVGPIFFGTVNTVENILDHMSGNDDIILSLRTVPLLDTTGISTLEDIIRRAESEGRRIYLSGLTNTVRATLERAGIIELLGEERIFWSADQAIIAADRYRAEQNRK